MASSHYSEYVNYYLRFYTRNSNPVFYSEVSKLNWEICDKVLSNLPTEEREIVMSVYQQTCFLGEAVERISRERKMSNKTVWRIINDTTYKVAKERGLV